VAAGKDEPESLRFTRVNAMLAVAGILTLTLGYWLLAQGSITAAPLLLVLAYVVLLPLAIIR
jgi:putative solute:sodium symporter small subunit